MKKRIFLLVSIITISFGLMGCISVDDTEETVKKEEKSKEKKDTLSYNDKNYTLTFKKIEILNVQNKDTGKRKNIVLVHYNFKNKTSTGLTFYDVATLDLYQDGKELMVNDADYYPAKRDKLVSNCDIKVKDGASIDVAEYHGMRNASSPIEVSLEVNSDLIGVKKFKIK